MDTIAKIGSQHFLISTDSGRSIFGQNIIDIFRIHILLRECTILITKTLGIYR